MTSIFRVLSVPMIALALPVHAAPATQEGAAKLQAAFESYIGRTPGVLTVKAEGSDYAVTLNPLPVLRSISGTPGPKATLAAWPLHLKLTELGGGEWDVALDEPWRFEISDGTGNGRMAQAARLRFDGIFDEGLAFFSTAHGEIDGFKAVRELNKGPAGKTRRSLSVARIAYTLSSSASSRAGVDATLSSVLDDAQEKTRSTASGGEPKVAALGSGKVQEQTKIAGLRTAAMLRLAGFLVEHPLPVRSAVARQDLKALVSAALPLLDDLDATRVQTGLWYKSSFGEVSVASLRSRLQTSGLVRNGKVRWAVDLKDASAPAGKMPAWVEGLLPEEAHLDMTVTDFDPLDFAYAVLDMATRLPSAVAEGAPEARSNASGAGEASSDPARTKTGPPLFPTPASGGGFEGMFPRGVLALDIARASLRNAKFQASVKGQATVGFSGVRALKAPVTIKGIDALAEILAHAPQPWRMLLSQGLERAKGLAGAGPDGTLHWDVTTTEGGGITVNGKPFEVLK